MPQAARHEAFPLASFPAGVEVDASVAFLATVFFAAIFFGGITPVLVNTRCLPLVAHGESG